MTASNTLSETLKHLIRAYHWIYHGETAEPLHVYLFEKAPVPKIQFASQAMCVWVNDYNHVNFHPKATKKIGPDTCIPIVAISPEKHPSRTPDQVLLPPEPRNRNNPLPRGWVEHEGRIPKNTPFRVFDPWHPGGWPLVSLPYDLSENTPIRRALKETPEVTGNPESFEDSSAADDEKIVAETLP